MALGRRILRQHRISLATRDRGSPPYCLGHIGYAVVPWKQRRGYATSALRELLREAKAEGLRYVEITTATENVASQRVIENNEGVFVEEFVAPESLGAGESGGTVSIS
jgi:predicted acetyltransferase